MQIYVRFNMTPTEFARFLYTLLDYKASMEPDFDDMWETNKVSEPVVNTLSVTTSKGEQFLINVKKVK